MRIPVRAGAALLATALAATPITAAEAGGAGGPKIGVLLVDHGEGGPGLGEPDVFEHVGLSAWHEWEVMGGRSPNYDQKLPKKLAVIERLRERYGEPLPISIGYGIDPRIGGGRRDVSVAVGELVDAGAEHLVVAYHGVGFSDVMQTHMLRHEIHEVLDEVAPEVTVSYTAPIGTTEAYVDAVVAKAVREVERIPEQARVAIHLSAHGLPTTRAATTTVAGTPITRWRGRSSSGRARRYTRPSHAGASGSSTSTATAARATTTRTTRSTHRSRRSRRGKRPASTT
jgi:hypothetical protein